MLSIICDQSSFLFFMGALIFANEPQKEIRGYQFLWNQSKFKKFTKITTHENLYLSHVPPQGPLPKIKNQ